MEKKEAADFLGVSQRTLERIAASGKLTKLRAKGKTSPKIVFDETELKALKRELEKSRPSEVFGRPNTPRPADAIGFRLDPFYVRKLEEEGATLGLSSGEYARRLLIRALEGKSIQDDVKALSRNLSDMFYLVLVSGLEVSEHEASEIVDKLTKGAKP